MDSHPHLPNVVALSGAALAAGVLVEVASAEALVADQAALAAVALSAPGLAGSGRVPGLLLLVPSAVRVEAARLVVPGASVVPGESTPRVSLPLEGRSYLAHLFTTVAGDTTVITAEDMAITGITPRGTTGFLSIPPFTTTHPTTRTEPIILGGSALQGSSLESCSSSLSCGCWEESSAAGAGVAASSTRCISNELLVRVRELPAALTLCKSQS